MTLPQRLTRRGFLATSSVAAFGVALPARHDHAARQTSSPETWDLSFLGSMNGRHKQVFDVSELSYHPLHVVSNWLRGHRDVHGLEPRQLTTVVGIAMSGLPVNLALPAWTKYPVGRLWKIKDPRTGKWSKRNVWLDIEANDAEREPLMRPDTSVTALVAGGTIFWQCFNGLRGAARMVAEDVKAPYDIVLADLRALLLPHVKLVPAHTMLLGLAQERGCAYEAL